MSCPCRPFALIAMCLGLPFVSSGCQQSAPAPTSSAIAGTTIEATSTLAESTTKPTSQETPFELESGFDLLTRDHFDAFAAEPDTWQSTDGGFRCLGKPKGYLYSKQPYENFTLRLDYRFPRPGNLKDESKFKGNTGFLVYITGEHKLWPICIEVQGKQIQMAAIKENGGAEPVTSEDNETARQQARKPVGQWNSLEIVSKDGALSVSLNGTPVSSSKPSGLTSGFVGVQAEDHPFEVRRMRIRSE